MMPSHRSLKNHDLPTIELDHEAFNTWLRADVLPAWDALKADPSRALTGEQVRARVRVKLQAMAHDGDVRRFPTSAPTMEK